MSPFIAYCLGLVTIPVLVCVTVTASIVVSGYRLARIRQRAEQLEQQIAIRARDKQEKHQHIQ